MQEVNDLEITKKVVQTVNDSNPPSICSKIVEQLERSQERRLLLHCRKEIIATLVARRSKNTAEAVGYCQRTHVTGMAARTVRCEP